jgi:hypothetical protein
MRGCLIGAKYADICAMNIRIMEMACIRPSSGFKDIFVLTGVSDQVASRNAVEGMVVVLVEVVSKAEAEETIGLLMLMQQLKKRLTVNERIMIRLWTMLI